jgi:hypothetical protein
VVNEPLDLRHPADILADHLRGHADAAVVCDTTADADATLAAMIDAGWTVGAVEYVAGKRVRTLIAPTTEPEQQQ